MGFKDILVLLFSHQKFETALNCKRFNPYQIAISNKTFPISPTKACLLCSMYQLSDFTCCVIIPTILGNIVLVYASVNNCTLQHLH